MFPYAVSLVQNKVCLFLQTSSLPSRPAELVDVAVTFAFARNGGGRTALRAIATMASSIFYYPGNGRLFVTLFSLRVQQD